MQAVMQPCRQGGMTSHGPRTTMAGLVEQHLARMRGRRAQTTIDTSRATLRRLALWWDGKAPRKVPKSMTETDMGDYLWGRHRCIDTCGQRSHKGSGLRDTLQPASFNHALGVIRRFVEWAVRQGEIKPEVHNAVDASQNVRTTRRRRLRLSVEQMVDMVEDTTDPWERFMCALCVGTLGRGSELLTIRVGDVDLDAGLIDWSRHKTGDDSDALPITSELSAEIERWTKHFEAECGPLDRRWFLLPSRAKVPPDRWKLRPTWQCHGNLYGLVKPHLARALSCPESDLRGEGVHTLRRSMARALYERLRAEAHGDPISVVQALLGHTQRGTTERYIGVESGREARDSLLRGRSMFG